jgi:hypothetical protein
MRGCNDPRGDLRSHRAAYRVLIAAALTSTTVLSGAVVATTHGMLHAATVGNNYVSELWRSSQAQSLKYQHQIDALKRAKAAAPDAACTSGPVVDALAALATAHLLVPSPKGSPLPPAGEIATTHDPYALIARATNDSSPYDRVHTVHITQADLNRFMEHDQPHFSFTPVYRGKAPIGVRVTRADINTVVGRVGLRVGDTISTVNGYPVQDPESLQKALAHPTDGVALEVLRHGRPMMLGLFWGTKAVP